jgi:hypothetical protein
VKRLAIEVPIADMSPQNQLALADEILGTIPSAAGVPVVVFGSQEVTDLAREVDAPYAAFSISEMQDDADEEDEELKGPLLLFCTAADQAATCQHIVEELWTGRVVVVVNAAWLWDAPPPNVQELADSLDAVYYFLPVSFAVRLYDPGAFLWTPHCNFRA